MRHLNNGTDHRHSKSCCDQSSPARRTMKRMSEYTGLIGSYQLFITAACTNTGCKMKGSHPRAADRCPFVPKHSLSQVTSFMQLGMLCAITYICPKCLIFVHTSLHTPIRNNYGITLTEEPFFNSLAPGRFKFNIRKAIVKLTSVNGGQGISYEIALRWMPQDLTDDKPTMVQVMAWCRQATSHYLSQCWPRSMSPNGITRPQWIKINDCSIIGILFLLK